MIRILQNLSLSQFIPILVFHLLIDAKRYMKEARKKSILYPFSIDGNEKIPPTEWVLLSIALLETMN